VTGTSVTLSWNAVSGAGAYSVGLRDLTTNALFNISLITGTSTTQSVIQGRSYRWDVASCTSSGGGDNTTNCPNRSGNRTFSVQATTTDIPVADGFDYPIGAKIRYTHANDGDGWYVADEFNEFNSGNGKYHLGEDWNAESGGNTDYGSPVYAIANGTIIFAGPATVSGWGNVLIIRHKLSNGTLVESLYGHVASFTRTSGNVTRGEQVATIGDGGGLYPAHLHLEIRFSNCPCWGSEGTGYSVTPNPVGWTAPSDFIDTHRPAGVAPAPAISNVTPNQVTGVPLPGRVNLTLTGSNFINGLSIFLTWTAGGGGSAPLSSTHVTFVSSTQVNITVGTSVDPDTWTVKVTNPDGQPSNVASFRVVAPVTGSRALGIDVSHYGGTINWNQVSSAGRTFAIIKATDGYRASQSNLMITDPNFSTYAPGAVQAGLLVGAYHFARPYINSARDEAAFFWSVAKNYIGPGFLPPALDIENPEDDPPHSQVSGIDPAVLTQWILDWIAELQRLTGNPNLKPMIYTTAADFARRWNVRPELAQYPLWIAYYERPSNVNPELDGAAPFGPWNYSWSFLQYSVTGNSVSGVQNSPVDLDAFNGDLAALTAFVNANTGGKTATTTALTPSLNPSAFGQLVTFTATVTSTGGAPTGAIAFKDGSTTLASGVLASGVATFSTTTLSPGSHTITAVYNGDNNFSGSTSSAVTQTVNPNPAATATALTTSFNPSAPGQAVTFTATVISSGATPTGMATFKDGATTLGTGPLLSGVAIFTTTALSVGNHTMTAVYGGDTNFAGSTSSALTQAVIVVDVPPTCTLTPNPPSIPQGQSATLFWTSQNATSGSINPDIGSVSTVASGSQSVTPTQTTAYRGTFNGLGGTGTCLTVITVVPPPANDNFVNATPIQMGQTLTGHNVGATEEAGEPDHAGNAGGKSVWWKFTASSTGRVTIGTVGSTFNTLLSIYTGNAVNALTPIASDNDSGGNLTSRLTFNATAGKIYRIAVDGFNSGSGAASGIIQLSMSSASRDFDGDSKSDILWRHTDGSVGIWEMNGTEIKAGLPVLRMPTEWSIVATGDFDGDGKSDILWRRTDGLVGIWLMNGAEIKIGQSIFMMPTEWSIAATGDFDGDGKSDILWRRTDGLVGIWLMNGAEIKIGQSLFMMPTEWSIVP
jgi:GH25 family lysozyme M1 (1,4-beta-N-acetylmuramidase)